MKPTILTYLLCFQQTFNADSSKDLMSDRQFLADAKMLCPYTSLCAENASLPFPGTKEETPCCQDCSCDLSCGLKNNCCFKHQDLFNTEETYQMICKSIKLNAKYIEASQFFRMINKCLSAHNSYTEVLTSDVLFCPVYASNTGFIYFNAEVALCNNATDLVPFQKTIKCSVQDDYMSDTDRILHGLEPNSDCHIQYLPPKGVDLNSEQCRPHVIRKCNVTGVMKEWEPFWTFCESFNATFVLQTSLREYVYGNIYCYMCNEQVYNNRSRHSINKCYTSFDKFQGGEHALTVILIPGLKFVDAETEINKPSRSCPQSKAIIVRSFTNLCRPIKCPFWKILVKGRCKFYINRWIGGPFAITIRLKSAESKSRISRSFFTNMSQNDRNDRVANWLKRKTMKRWKMAVFYHPSIDNVSVEYLIIDAKCPFVSVNPKYIEETVKAAFDDSWYIVDKTETITLNLYMTVGRTYVVRAMKLNDIQHSENVYSYSYSLLREGEKNPNNYKDEPLFYLSDRVYEGLVEGILLTKMNFCHQIDLLPNEYEDTLEGIFFKVKNVTLYDFRRVNSIASSDGNVVKQTVRVCLSEFELLPSIGISNHLFEANMLILLFIKYF